jgi:hypothetical protein
MALCEMVSTRYARNSGGTSTHFLQWSRISASPRWTYVQGRL